MQRLEVRRVANIASELDRFEKWADSLPKSAVNNSLLSRVDTRVNELDDFYDELHNKDSPTSEELSAATLVDNARCCS